NTYTLTINVAPSLGARGLATAWTVNQAYSSTVTITGGTGPLSNLNFTNLPTGLSASLSGNTITVRGTPTPPGDCSRDTLSAQQAAGVVASGTFDIKINAAPAIGALTKTQWTQGKSGFSGTMTISDGTPSFSIVGTATGLPTGLAAVLSGNIISFAGTPTVAG